MLKLRAKDPLAREEITQLRKQLSLILEDQGEVFVSGPKRTYLRNKRSVYRKTND